MLNMTPRTPSPPSSMGVEILFFGAVSLPRVQDDSTASRGLQWNLGREPPSLSQDIENASLGIWRGSANRSGPKSLLVTNYKKRLTPVLANNGYSTKY